MYNQNRIQRVIKSALNQHKKAERKSPADDPQSRKMRTIIFDLPEEEIDNAMDLETVVHTLADYRLNGEGMSKAKLQEAFDDLSVEIESAKEDLRYITDREARKQLRAILDESIKEYRAFLKTKSAGNSSCGSCGCNCQGK